MRLTRFDAIPMGAVFQHGWRTWRKIKITLKDFKYQGGIDVNTGEEIIIDASRFVKLLDLTK